MKQFIHSLSLTLAVTALLGSCSRPVATFQKSQPERFYSQHQPTEPVMVSEEVMTPAINPANVRQAVPEVVQATPPIATQTQQASDALASLKFTHSTDRHLTKRIERAEKMLADVNQKSTTQTVSTAKKTSLVQRMMLKTMDKKIQKHLAPKEGKAMTGYVRLGAIIALAGLLLLLIGNGVGATIGLIALIAGLVLVLLGVINEGSLIGQL